MGADDTLISTAEVHERLGEPGVAILDVRWDLDDKEGGARAYAAAHLPGAVYLSWLRDFSDPDDPVEGQLAPPQRFAEAMGRAGVGEDTLVVVYDDAHILMAARLAWALRHYGHDRVRVLDGGWPKWVAEGRPTEPGPVHPEPARFTPRSRGGTRMTKEDMLGLVERGGAVILDCRMDRTWNTARRHIPGARRFPAPRLLRPEDGTYLPPEDVAAMAEAAGASPDKPVALYCGGGISASAAYLALRRAGYRDLRVYDGSWSEWGADPDTPKVAH